MARITTPPGGIFATSDTFDTCNPLTGPIRGNDIAAARFGVWLGGLTYIKAQPAWQFSDDGVDWSKGFAATPIQSATAWATASEWTWSDFSTFAAIEVGGTSSPFVRFGLAARNTVSALPPQTALGRVCVMSRPLYPGSLQAPAQRAWTQNTSDFVPLTQQVPASGVSSVRAELDLSDIGSGVTVQAGWQSANEPVEPADWSAVTVFGTARTANGVYPATSYTSLTTTGRYLRFGVKVTQASGTDLRSCEVSVRFDWR